MRLTWLRSGREDSDEAFEYFLERGIAGLSELRLFHAWSGRVAEGRRTDKACGHVGRPYKSTLALLSDDYSNNLTRE